MQQYMLTCCWLYTVEAVVTEQHSHVTVDVRCAIYKAFKDLLWSFQELFFSEWYIVIIN